MRLLLAFDSSEPLLINSDTEPNALLISAYMQATFASHSVPVNANVSALKTPSSNSFISFALQSRSFGPKRHFFISRSYIFTYKTKLDIGLSCCVVSFCAGLCSHESTQPLRPSSTNYQRLINSTWANSGYEIGSQLLSQA